MHVFLKAARKVIHKTEIHSWFGNTWQLLNIFSSCNIQIHDCRTNLSSSYNWRRELYFLKITNQITYLQVVIYLQTSKVYDTGTQAFQTSRLQLVPEEFINFYCSQRFSRLKPSIEELGSHWSTVIKRSNLKNYTSLQCFNRKCI